ncbi:MAG: hypothetical protein HY021_08485 [Burkholderiales bacterium]|nr:hypothetical protein [Burkholderiales bacterium]
MKTTFVVSALALVLTACATSDSARPATGSPTGSAIGDTAVTPLNDLNLVRGDIPAPLLTAQKAPYAMPATRSCDAVSAEVLALDSVLGPDLDVPPQANNPGLIERGGDAATGALRGAAEGLVPFRGWVRKLSGAERYSREVAAAIAAGTVRRSFLKGLGQALDCKAPAAPRSAQVAALPLRPASVSGWSASG